MHQVSSQTGSRLLYRLSRYFPSIVKQNVQPKNLFLCRVGC